MKTEVPDGNITVRGDKCDCIYQRVVCGSGRQCGND